MGAIIVHSDKIVLRKFNPLIIDTEAINRVYNENTEKPVTTLCSYNIERVLNVK